MAHTRFPAGPLGSQEGLVGFQQGFGGFPAGYGDDYVSDTHLTLSRVSVPNGGLVGSQMELGGFPVEPIGFPAEPGGIPVRPGRACWVASGGSVGFQQSSVMKIPPTGTRL
jgi:hypothetical protein